MLMQETDMGSETIKEPELTNARGPIDYTQLRVLSMEMALRIPDQRHHTDVIESAKAIERYIKGEA